MWLFLLKIISLKINKLYKLFINFVKLINKLFIFDEN